MITDLLHNKIIKDTVTEGFISAFEDKLVPMLSEKYGDSLESVQMYEDYLSDNFKKDGEFYYPLTVVCGGEVLREWIKWDISEPKNFGDGVPYSYIGEDELEISIANDVPSEFSSSLDGRASYFEGGYVTFKIQSASDDKTFLAGKYSQTFIDGLTRGISEKIESTFAVTGIEDSGVEVMMVFAPGTYMEHVVDNVTYRRLLITARGCSARDLWVKWTNNVGLTPYTVSDNVQGDEITFELGEDVSQKIREKEYRFLVRSSADKYQSAMGRKNITEWRDLIKRVIKRGELVKSEIVTPNPEAEGALAFKLQELLTGSTMQSAPTYSVSTASESEEKDNSDLTALLKTVLGKDNEEETPVAEYIPEETEEAFEDAEQALEESEPFDSFAAEESEETEEAQRAEEFDAIEAGKLDEAIARESYEEYEEVSENETESVEELRRKIEAEIREKLALEAKARAEAEAESLRRAHDELKRENERLAEAARRAEQERIEAAEKHRLEIEAREHAEAREKERIAQAARLAIMEQQRLANEKAEAERRQREEDERLRMERARLEEEARIAEARRIEEERIRAEMAAKAKAEEEAALRERERAAAASPERRVPSSVPGTKYVSKNARLLFRAPIDPNITKRIHEIILTTIKYFHKENVYMKIKATVPDSTTVNLRFVEIPEEETELLVQIIKVLGKSNLGITKVFLE